ncbi:MFS transporter [Aminobacter sp. HY435]|uniref:MFS transporter n=1 Tax=Aminobacter sp. HY435 TaxID=2970917 RepID=UPI0022B95117|nr:MFS transporter [Aminobacter sp. HY435]
MNQSGSPAWDPKYEWKAVALLACGFALVGVDRFMIMPLFPVMMKDLDLDYQDLGHITGVLAVTWGISAIFMGNLSDRIGHRRVIIPALIIFSLLAGLSGAATGVFSLMLIRRLMGFAEGAYTPASIVATLEASKPSRHGLNIGLQQTAFPLFGLGVAPIVVTQLLGVVDWHWIFAMVSLPGLIVAFLMYRVLRDTKPSVAASHTSVADVSDHKWSDVLRYHNIPRNIVTMLCWLTCLIVLSALFPSYLTDYLHLNITQMGFVLSAIGFGGMFGTFLMPTLSDRLGRKPVVVIASIGAVGAMWMLMSTGPDAMQLFIWLLVTLFFFGLIAMTTGPLSVEAVPAKLMSSASGIVIGVGEVFGGGIAPAIAGYVAQHYGIQYVMHLALGALVLGALVVLSLRETSPLHVRHGGEAAKVLRN